MTRRPAIALALVLGAVLLGACSSSDDGSAGSSDAVSSDVARTGGAAEPDGDAASDTATPGAPTSDDTDGDQVSAAAPTPAPGLPRLGAQRVQTDVLARLPGDAGGACVSVGAARDVRSGSFAAGPFDSARSEAESGTVRLYFIPEHAKSMPGVLVTGTNAASGASFQRRQRAVADADQFRLYDLQLPAGPGSWQIRAVAGPDSGCWTVDLG